MNTNKTTIDDYVNLYKLFSIIKYQFKLQNIDIEISGCKIDSELQIYTIEYQTIDWNKYYFIFNWYISLVSEDFKFLISKKVIEIKNELSNKYYLYKSIVDKFNT